MYSLLVTTRINYFSIGRELHDRRGTHGSVTTRQPPGSSTVTKGSRSRQCDDEIPREPSLPWRRSERVVTQCTRSPLPNDLSLHSRCKQRFSSTLGGLWNLASTIHLTKSDLEREIFHSRLRRVSLTKMFHTDSPYSPTGKNISKG